MNKNFFESSMKNLTQVIQRSDSKAGKNFDIFILLLIVYSIVTFSIETVPGLPTWMENFLFFSEVIVTVLFTVEYILRLIASEKPLRYMCSFYGIIDLIAIAPFYLSLGIDLRGVRAFRLFRLIRIFKLTRYSKAMSRFVKALSLAKEEAVLFGISTIIVVYLAAVGIYYFEHEAQPEVFKSVFHSLWWAVATMTTVGYGDIYPITAAGKFFTFIILMLGLGIVAVPAGLIASALSRVKSEDGS